MKYKSDAKHYFLTSLAKITPNSKIIEKTFPIKLSSISKTDSLIDVKEQYFSNSPTWYEDFSRFNKGLKTLNEVYKEAESYL